LIIYYNLSELEGSNLLGLQFFLGLLGHLEQVPHSHLAGVVNDELVVTQVECALGVHAGLRLGVALNVGCDAALGHFDSVWHEHRLLVVGASIAASVDRMVRLGSLDFGVGVPDLLHVAEGNFTEEQDLGLLVVIASVRVSETLLEHVGEVNTLAEHIASRGRFRWCDPQALREDADEVEDRAAMVEEAAVAHFTIVFEVFSLSLPLDLEDVDLVRREVD